jgi:hypothetical protein
VRERERKRKKKRKKGRERGRKIKRDREKERKKKNKLFSRGSLTRKSRHNQRQTMHEFEPSLSLFVTGLCKEYKEQTKEGPFTDFAPCCLNCSRTPKRAKAVT